VDAITLGDNAAVRIKDEAGNNLTKPRLFTPLEYPLNCQLSPDFYRPSIMSSVRKSLDGEFGLAIKQLLPVLFSSR
jgi:hypothetical protein